MSRRAKKSLRPVGGERRRIVAEAFDTFSSDDWRSPISDYPRVLELLNDCQSYEVKAPIDLLNDTLRSIGVAVAIDKDVEDDGDFLEQLLAPHLEIENDSWDGNFPGLSGIFRTAYLTLGATGELRRRLSVVEKVLVEWYEQPDLAAEIARWEPERAEKAKSEQRQRELKQLLDGEKRAQRITAKKEAWERNLFDQVFQAVRVQDVKPFSRDDFLVYNGSVFYLARCWRQTPPGNLIRVVALLRQVGIDVVWCRLRAEKSKRTTVHRSRYNVNAWDNPKIEIEVETLSNLEKAIEAWWTWLAWHGAR